MSCIFQENNAKPHIVSQYKWDKIYHSKIQEMVSSLPKHLQTERMLHYGTLALSDFKCCYDEIQNIYRFFFN